MPAGFYDVSGEEGGGEGGGKKKELLENRYALEILSLSKNLAAQMPLEAVRTYHTPYIMHHTPYTIAKSSSIPRQNSPSMPPSTYTSHHPRQG
ncbi:hypothetical protein EON63_11620 [archaeon]|nr:MAG: hypothetical protein EON63_11620 [archaeon]